MRSRHRVAFRVLFSTVLLTVWSGSAVHLRAWGPAGHRIIVKIALAAMKPETAQEASAVLANDDLVAAANWADRIVADRPATAFLHTVPIPVSAAAYDRQRDCRGNAHDECVVEALLAGERMLGMGRRLGLQSASDVRERLEFYLNLVGEVHQPLNCIDAGDHGGRDVRVRLPNMPSGAVTDLRSLWDVGLIAGRHESEDEYVSRLRHALPHELGSLAPAVWARESHDLALHSVYAYPGFVAGSTPRIPVILDAAYLDAAGAAVDKQLALAGIRLARMLDNLLN